METTFVWRRVFRRQQYITGATKSTTSLDMHCIGHDNNNCNVNCCYCYDSHCLRLAMCEQLGIDWNNLKIPLISIGSNSSNKIVPGQTQQNSHISTFPHFKQWENWEKWRKNAVVCMWFIWIGIDLNAVDVTSHANKPIYHLGSAPLNKSFICSVKSYKSNEKIHAIKAHKRRIVPRFNNWIPLHSSYIWFVCTFVRNVW